MALLTGSLPSDAGDNSILPATDQRGFARKKDGNGDGKAIVDIGAFEITAVPAGADDRPLTE